jgi:type IV pilus assembly protein PilQ
MKLGGTLLLLVVGVTCARIEPLQGMAAAAGDSPQAAADPAPPPAPPVPGLTPQPIRLAPAPAPRVSGPPPAAPRPAAFTGQRISLDFKDADIQNVLRVLADVSGLNIIATDDVKGKVTLHLTDVPWDQALDLVLRSNRLEKMQEGSVVRISTVARLKEEREALRAAQEAERELEPLRVKYVRVNYARADEALVDKVKGVLSDRGSVTFDERTNTVVVRDIPHGIEDASELVRELDVQSPQVLIEANIVEATEDFARGLGVQWGYRYNAGPATGNPTGVNFPGTVGVGGAGLGTGSAPPGSGGTAGLPVPFLADFPVPSNFGSGFRAGQGSALDLALGSLDGTQSLAARLTALEQQGKGRVVSRPRVITMNNVAATIQSLTIIRVKLPSTGTVINTGTGGAAGSASTATEKINTGITLVVTPQISSDGYVLMNIYAKSSQPDFTQTTDGIPSEVSREANSNVLIPNGETVVLGGIFRHTTQDNESGLPYLRSIPVLGWLFKNLLRNHHREELLVFISPKIVTVGAAPLPTAGRLWEERRQGG